MSGTPHLPMASSLKKQHRQIYFWVPSVSLWASPVRALGKPWFTWGLGGGFAGRSRSQVTSFQEVQTHPLLPLPNRKDVPTIPLLVLFSFPLSSPDLEEGWPGSGQSCPGPVYRGQVGFGQMLGSLLHPGTSKGQAKHMKTSHVAKWWILSKLD